MQQLWSTTPGPDGHTHIVYTNSETGVAEVAPAKDGHNHEIMFIPAEDPRPPSPEIPPQIDPMTGQPMIDPNTGMPDQGQPADPGSPGSPATWVIRPAPDARSAAEVPAAPQAPGGLAAPQMSNQPLGTSTINLGLPAMSPELHEHTLVEIEIETKKVETPDEELLSDCLALWREAAAITHECREEGEKAYQFYKGNQWDSSVKRSLTAIDRAALTINEIGPSIDTLIGYQMEQRTDFRVLPTEGGDQRIADMLNVVLKNITDQCAFPRHETKVFTDMCITGFGGFVVAMDFERNLEGDPTIKRFPNQDLLYGPHEEDDLSDCEYEIRSRMVSIATLEKMWPEKAEEIKKSYGSYANQFGPSELVNDKGKNGTNTDYRYATSIPGQPYTVDGNYPLVDVERKQFRFWQCTRKTYKEVTVVFNADEGFFYTAYDWKKEDLEAAANLSGFQVLTQRKTRMHVTRFAGNVVLSDENPAEFPVNDFMTVPVYAYRHDGEYWGKVRIAMDPQKEINKRRSQMMDMMNRLGASVYYTEPDTFVSSVEEERFNKNRAKPGAKFRVNNLDRTPKLEPGAEIPVSLVNIMQMDQENLQRLLNIVVQQEGANESGAMFLEKKKGRITGNQFLFDNLSFAKQKLGKILLQLVQRYYSPERIQRLLNTAYSKQKFKVGGQDFAEYTPEEIEELLGDADIGSYDILITEAAFAASTRLAIAQMLFEALSKGVQVPMDLIVEFVDAPADVKLKIGESMQQQSEMQAQSAKSTADAEVKKTLIAKGEYTVSPEEAQNLGLVPAANPPVDNALRESSGQANDTERYQQQLGSSVAQ